LMSPETFYSRSTAIKSPSETSDKIQISWNIPSRNALNYGAVDAISSGLMIYSMSVVSKVQVPLYAKVLLPIAVGTTSAAYKIQLNNEMEYAKKK
jgi:hypothetical protein